MYLQSFVALSVLQLITSSRSVVLQQPSATALEESTTNSFNGTGDLGTFPIPGTSVQLGVYTSSLDQPLPDRQLLMCMLQGMKALVGTNAGDPIENGRLQFNYGTVEVLLSDHDSPTDRFLNDIADWSLYGIGEWMTRNDRFRELVVSVLYNQRLVGAASVKLRRTGDSATASGTAVSTAPPNAAVSPAGTGGVEAA